VYVFTWSSPPTFAPLAITPASVAAMGDVGRGVYGVQFHPEVQHTPQGRDLLRKIPGVQPKITMECCGHDGTHAMKVEGFEASIKVGQKAFDGMKGAQAEVWATDCPLAALQFQQHAGKKPMHPMSILARAYREDGFEKKIEAPAATEPPKKDGEER